MNYDYHWWIFDLIIPWHFDSLWLGIMTPLWHDVKIRIRIKIKIKNKNDNVMSHDVTMSMYCTLYTVHLPWHCSLYCASAHSFSGWWPIADSHFHYRGSPISQWYLHLVNLIAMAPHAVLACNAWEDRACPVCYYCYLRKFLNKEERKNLKRIVQNCECDFLPPAADGEPHNESLKAVVPLHLPDMNSKGAKGM